MQLISVQETALQIDCTLHEANFQSPAPVLTQQLATKHFNLDLGMGPSAHGSCERSQHMLAMVRAWPIEAAQMYSGTLGYTQAFTIQLGGSKPMLVWQQ